ncbi:hypothetical protein [Streptomyces rubradiris]|uniref:Uncharacterized protein n=1 Tax=Streptomyces rubradiris TaxID=285531 RepID=A0ABQ3RF52_STRRR|nr:hypothetical protein [Streptomyces rubradiris]GHG97535.1 hypothetical protein GCM10018792_09450 [Streptomyces rubradiris]GHI54437.1 hypothetical protein Srubr_42830 [Streptomyces rubradiris]
MTTLPARLCAGTLVVFEGPSRVLWTPGAPGSPVPAGLWPTAADAAEVAARIARREPVLVVLEEIAATVSVWRHELDRAPAELAELAEGEGELLDLRVPALDWLPEPLRERGLAFWHRSTARAAREPAVLLPAVLLDEPDEGAPGVRFARRLLPFPLTTTRLAHLVAGAFPQETPHAC